MLLALAWLLLGVTGLLVLVWPSLFDLPALVDLDREEALRLLAAVALYAVSHVLRFLRLALLLQDRPVRMRDVLKVHLLTSGLALLLPFKLSELVRIREVGVVTGSWRTGLLAVWLERAFDAAMLVCLLLVTIVSVSDSLSVLTPLLVVMATFVALTLILITVVPENIRELMLHLVRRPSGKRTVTALRLLREALSMLHEAPALVRGRLPTLLLLSGLIWAGEVAVVSVAVPGLDAGLSQLSTGVLALLSSVSSGVTAVMPGSGDRLVETLHDLGYTAEVSTYRLCLSIPVLVAAFWAASSYLPRRLRARGESVAVGGA